MKNVSGGRKRNDTGSTQTNPFELNYNKLVCSFQMAHFATADAGTSPLPLHRDSDFPCIHSIYVGPDLLQLIRPQTDVSNEIVRSSAPENLAA